MATSDRAAELLTTLEDEFTALTTSDGWKRYLKMQGQLHKYSTYNTLLIAMQNPDATHVAGYHAWRKLGRQVRRGERGIAILVPYVFRKRRELSDVLDELEDGKTTDEPQTAVRFGVGHVFDIAQTDGDEAIITWGYARGDANTAGEGLRKLEAYAQSLGYTVTRKAEPGTIRGHCDHKGRAIVLDADLDVVNATATMAHELAHAILHDGITDYRERRGQYEVEAESVAYVVVTALGLDTSSCALPYLAHWSAGDVKVVKETAKRVRDAAARLLAVTDAAEEPAEAPAELVAA